MSKRLPLFLLLLTAIVSCKKNDQPNTILETPTDTPGAGISINNFPLAVGNSWTYKVQYQERNAVDIAPISTALYTQTITYDTVINGYHLYYLSGASFSYPEYRMSVAIQGRYYTQNATGLYHVPAIDHIDAGYMNDSTVLELPYVSTVNWQKDAVDSNGKRYYQTDLGLKNVTTPSGKFDCIKLSKGYSYGYGAVHYDTYRYYNTKGLIREVKNNGWSGGPGKGPVTMLTITTLESVNF